jgi:3-methyl-2-oxobutanoate hydroxymethyltransferase
MYANTQVVSAERRKITAPELLQRKDNRERITMVTAYDYTMARLVDEANIDMVLVGDSLGMIVQGHANTLPVTLDEMVYHCRGVARGLARAHLVGDMPFMSYQASPVQALETAGRLMKDGACESVKLEGGLIMAESIAKIVGAGIPVVGHIGLTPQSVHALGGFRVQGRGEIAARRIIEDARAVEQAGAFCIVLEAVPPDVAAEVTAMLSIPTIGIGAGASCDGQVLVCTDLLGMARGHRPKFVKQFATLGDDAVAAMRAFAAEVHSGAFPSIEHSYKANNTPAPRADESARHLRELRLTAVR